MEPQRPLWTRHAVLDQPADYYNRTWRIDIAPSEVEQVFRSQYWNTHAQRLTVGDLIRVRLWDRSFEFWLSVLQKPTKGQAIVRWVRPDVPKLVLAGAAQVEREERELAKVVSPSKH